MDDLLSSSQLSEAAIEDLAFSSVWQTMVDFFQLLKIRVLMREEEQDLHLKASATLSGRAGAATDLEATSLSGFAPL